MSTGEKRRKGRRAHAAPDDAKGAVLAAALVHVPFDGFTTKVLENAAREAGLAPGEVVRLFPAGPLSLVETFSEHADAEMARLLAKTRLSNMKVRERISLAVKTRIAVLRPHKEAARRAAAFLTLPPNAATGLKLLYNTVDAIWRAVGDTSTDFNFYTKRAILAGVYSSTLMRWFSDTSDDEGITNAFIQRRIDDVMRFEKFKAQIRERASGLPSLSDILNPAPRGRSPRRSGAKAG
ncbi:MAG TPA: COQ9 family protein [Rhizomicrobium sp.]|nr:COQ9 family protein [Rhizomicrobium sp.]